MKYVTSFFGAAAQFNHLHHNHGTQARKRRSVLTVAQSGFTHIPPDYPREKSSVTFPQITHTVDQRSESNLQEVPPTSHQPPLRRPEDLTMTRPRSRRVKLSTQPSDTFAVVEASEKRGLCPGFITAAQLGAHSETQFSTFFWLIFYSLF